MCKKSTTINTLLKKPVLYMKLAFRELGKSGKPFVVLHGLLGASDNWLTLSKKWSEHNHMFLMDLRNHGKSPHDSFHTYEAMAEDLNEFLHDHEIRKINILGHSMGGKVAMTFAMLYPHKIEKLIVVDIAPKKYSNPEFEDIITTLLNMQLSTIHSLADANKQLEPEISDIVLRQFLLKNLVRDRQHNFSWRVNLQSLHNNRAALAGEIPSGKFDGKTMFIVGGKSNYVLKDDTAAIKDRFPNANIHTVENAGHWVHAEQPEIVQQLVSDFLSNR